MKTNTPKNRKNCIENQEIGNERNQNPEKPKKKHIN